MPSGQFSQLLLEGLDHYRKGRMMEAVRAWEEAYLLEPTNLRAREFLRSALERIHAHMGPAAAAAAAAGGASAAETPAPSTPHPWLPPPESSGQTLQFAAPPDPLAETAVTRVPTFFEPPTESPPTPPPAPPPAAAAAKKPPPPPLPEPSSPWDDGPSMALPHEERPSFAGDETSGAWKIHTEPLPMEAVADHEIDVWMRGARELLALNDFSGALELLGKLLERKPNDRDAQQMHDLCEHNLTLMFESKIGAMEGRPRMAIPPDEVIWLNLDPRAGFVLAQIDGEVTFEDLYAICGLKRLDTARILSELLEQGVVRIDGQDRAVAKRAMHRS